MSTAVDTDQLSVETTPRIEWRDLALIGSFAFVVAVCGAGRPSLWLDEAATISASTRSLSELVDLLRHVDAVHGLYYVLMHCWFSVFPATEFWARVPSALLVGGAAAGVVVLGRQLSTRAVAVSAGVVFALLPRTTWAGVEARSYALSMFDAVWLTVLCVVAVRGRRTWIWLGYAVALALATVANVFAVFVVAVHAVIVLTSAPARRTVGLWLGAVVAAVAAVTPYLMLIKAQQAQVNWIWPVGPGTLGQVLGDQYFPAVIAEGAQPLAADGTHHVTPELASVAMHAWALVAPLVVVVLVVTVLAVRRSRQPDAIPAALRETDVRQLVWVGVVWIVVPTALIVAHSVVREPMYQPHYLAFTVPGPALLLGLAVAVVGREPRRIAAVLVVFALAAVPNYLAQRGPYSKMGRDHSQVADLIGARAVSGECLNVDVKAQSEIVEPVTAGRPEAFLALRDPGKVRTAVDGDALFETRKPITAWAAELPSCVGLWTITAKDDSVPEHERGESLAPGALLKGIAAHQVPAAAGFRAVERWQFNLTQVVRYAPRHG